jgi:hypothetical protein
MAVRERPTYKQAAFAKAYIEEKGNATEAVVKAGYKVKDRTVAKAMGTEILAVPSVQREIATWQEFLEREALPSLQVIKHLRDQSDDQRVRLAASRDLLNRGGVGKTEAKTSVLAVFANMDETKLLEKMAQLAERNSAKPSPDVVDVSPDPSGVS